jgi:hypothetical protein
LKACSNRPHWTLTAGLLRSLAGSGVLLIGLATQAQLSVIPPARTPVVFAGSTQSVAVLFHNPSAGRVEVPIWFRLYQAGSATVMPLGEAQSWKRQEVLPGQTVLESVPVAFPPVRAESRCVIRWQTDAECVLGVTDAWVLPQGQLRELKTLAGDGLLGLLDAASRIRPALEEEQVPFTDLTDSAASRPPCHLAIVAETAQPESEHRRLAHNLRRWLGAGLNLVWLKPPGPASPGDTPLQVIRPGQGTLVIANLDRLEGLANDPAAQRFLVALARLATQPTVNELSEPTP